jgi:uncharacterized membrane protein
MRFFGHPIHPMIIHFPTALLPADLVLSCLHYYKNEPVYGQAAFFCLAGGVSLGILAALSGVLDLLYIPKENKQALAAGLVHGFVNGIIILFFAVFAYREWSAYPSIAAPGTASLITKGILVLILFGGNYLGGKLIYQYRVGVDKN